MTSTVSAFGFEFGCDDCGEIWLPPPLGRGSAKRNLIESWELAKDAGWRVFKGAKDEWQHRCPECAR